MRSSCLFTNDYRATKLGLIICGLSLLMLFTVSSLVWFRISSIGANVEYDLKLLQGPEIGSLPISNGSVYLLDSQEGQIFLIGRFSTTNAGGRGQVVLPAAYRDQVGVNGILWKDQDPGLITYVDYIADQSLRDNLLENLRSGWEDPDVRDKMRDFAVTILGSAAANRMDAGDVMSDKKVRKAFEDFAVSIEPFLRDAALDVLWLDDGEVGKNVPNAKLLWAAKRLIFGTDRSVLLLQTMSAGNEYSEDLMSNEGIVIIERIY